MIMEVIKFSDFPKIILVQMFIFQKLMLNPNIMRIP